MQKLDLLAYNTRGGFADVERRNDLIDFIKSGDPDIAFFSDALPNSANIDDIGYVRRALESQGYEVLISDAYEEDRTDGSRTIGIFRQGLNAKHMYIGEDKSTYRLAIKDRIVIGRHFDDRNEDKRLALLEEIGDADVIMGDFNALHKRAMLARALRLLMPIGNSFPEVNTDFSMTEGQISRGVSLFQRFARMGDGRLLLTMEDTGLIDTNARRAPTMHGIAQLDHIVIKSDIPYSDFKVHKDVNLSDHKPISVSIKL